MKFSKIEMSLSSLHLVDPHLSFSLLGGTHTHLFISSFRGKRYKNVHENMAFTSLLLGLTRCFFSEARDVSNVQESKVFTFPLATSLPTAGPTAWSQSWPHVHFAYGPAGGTTGLFQIPFHVSFHDISL